MEEGKGREGGGKEKEEWENFQHLSCVSSPPLLKGGRKEGKENGRRKMKEGRMEGKGKDGKDFQNLPCLSFPLFGRKEGRKGKWKKEKEGREDGRKGKDGETFNICHVCVSLSLEGRKEGRKERKGGKGKKEGSFFFLSAAYIPSSTLPPACAPSCLS
jgi:hypothetical protein